MCEWPSILVKEVEYHIFENFKKDYRFTVEVGHGKSSSFGIERKDYKKLICALEINI